MGIQKSGGVCETAIAEESRRGDAGHRERPRLNKDRRADNAGVRGKFALPGLVAEDDCGRRGGGIVAVGKNAARTTRECRK